MVVRGKATGGDRQNRSDPQEEARHRRQSGETLFLIFWSFLPSAFLYGQTLPNLLRSFLALSVITTQSTKQAPLQKADTRFSLKILLIPITQLAASSWFPLSTSNNRNFPSLFQTLAFVVYTILAFLFSQKNDSHIFRFENLPWRNWTQAISPSLPGSWLVKQLPPQIVCPISIQSFWKWCRRKLEASQNEVEKKNIAFQNDSQPVERRTNSARHSHFYVGCAH